MRWIGITSLVVLGTLCLTRQADAQARVLVLPWSVADSDSISVTSRISGIRAALDAQFDPLTPEEARTRFVQLGSGDPPLVSDSEVDHWLALSRDAVRSLANADYVEARAALEQAQALSDRAAAELNREEARARQVLDTCLYGVRAYVETSDPGANEAAMECRRLVPRVAPSPYIHTPEVVEVLGRVDRRLAQGGTSGTLTIDSEPSACIVRVNGVVLGHTPLVSTDLASGDYRVQVECGDHGRGRIHRLALTAAAASLHVDARFDSVVRTDGDLSLVYADGAQAQLHRVADAVQVASVLSAEEVWLVSGDSLERIRVSSGALVAWAYGAGDDMTTSALVDELAHERSIGERARTPARVVVADQAPVDGPPVTRTAGPDVGACVLVGVGAAAAIAGGVLIGVSVLDYNAVGAPMGSEHTYAQAAARQSGADLFVDVGIALAAVGGVAAAAGVVRALVSGSGSTPEVAVRVGPFGVDIQGAF